MPIWYVEILTVIPIKTGRRVTDVRLGWSRKDPEQLKAAYEEAQRPKVGRRQSIRGGAEYVSDPVPRVEDQLRTKRIELRRSNASHLEADRSFLLDDE